MGFVRKMVYIKCDTCTTKYYIRADSPLLKSTSRRKPRCSKCAHRKFDPSGKMLPNARERIEKICCVCKIKSKVRVDYLTALSKKGRSYRCNKCSNRRVDLSGNVIPRAYDRVEARCVTCGEHFEVRYSRRKSPKTYKCQACASSAAPSNKLNIRPGDIYGMLTIISEDTYSVPSHSRMFTCLCECGRNKKVLLSSLRNKHTQSCGCKAKSDPEKELYDFVSSIIDESLITRNCRKTLGGLELDLLIKKYNLAIEFNGLYFHSENFKDKDYHLNKTKRCSDIGIFLLHIWEDDWALRPSQVKAMIKGLLDKVEDQVFARKTKLSTPSKLDKKLFYDNNHIQGSCGSGLDIGLYEGSHLVACMSFVEHRAKEWGLVRYATSKSVVGGFRKILNHFKKTYTWEKITSFSDLSWSNGGLYEKPDWVLDKVLRPDYKYVKSRHRYHKFGFRQGPLKKKLKTYNPDLSEHQNMLNNGIYRIYDCGKMRYIQRNEDLSG